MEQLCQIDTSFTSGSQKDVKKSSSFMKNRMTNIKNNCPDAKINLYFTFAGFDDLGELNDDVIRRFHDLLCSSQYL